MGLPFVKKTELLLQLGHFSFKMFNIVSILNYLDAGKGQYLI